jgi:hypothetical protein
MFGLSEDIGELSGQTSILTAHLKNVEALKRSGWNAAGLCPKSKQLADANECRESYDDIISA